MHLSGLDIKKFKISPTTNAESHFSIILLIGNLEGIEYAVSRKYPARLRCVPVKLIV